MGVELADITPYVSAISWPGLKGDGVSDDAEPLAALFAAGVAAGKPVVLEPKTYCVGSELALDDRLDVRGTATQTTLKAIGSTPFRSVLHVNNVRCDVRDLVIDANDIAQYGVSMLTGGRSTFSRLDIKNAISSGVRMLAAGNNDYTLFQEHCQLRDNGRIYYSGSECGTEFGSLSFSDRVLDTTDDSNPIVATVGATAVDVTTVTFSGGNFTPATAELLAEGAVMVHPGDPMCVAVTVDEVTTFYWGVVATVAETSIGCYGISDAPQGAADAWAIGNGGGVDQAAHNDNNVCMIRDCSCERNCAFPIGQGGLYGMRIDNLQAIGAPWGAIRIGLARGAPNIGSAITQLYYGDGTGTPSHDPSPIQVVTGKGVLLHFAVYPAANYPPVRMLTSVADAQSSGFVLQDQIASGSYVQPFSSISYSDLEAPP